MKKASNFQQILLAALTVAAVAGACFPFAEAIGYRSVALILLLVVSVLAMRLSLAATLVAAFLSALVWNFFFVPPHFTLHMDSAEDALFMAMYFIVATLNGIINHRLRQIEAIRSEKIERENALKLYNALFNSLSHDLRTPIAAVIGATDTLRENRTQLTDNQQVALLDEISGGSLRLSEQVENLLNMSRIEAGMIQPKKEWCDARDLLFGIAKKCKPATASHVLEVKITENFPLVQLDFGLTEQVLENLVQNALRHTPDGSQIELSAKIFSDRKGHFEENEKSHELQTVRDEQKNWLLIEVRDNGKGFPTDEIERVFDKFYRLGDSKTGGSGLGLFIARGFVEAQGVEISLRNLPTGGACFAIEMPTEILNQVMHSN